MTEHDSVYVRVPKLPDSPYSVYSNYFIGLRHQCDEWTIARTSDYAEAIQRLETFIAKAQEALTALRAGESYNLGEE